VIRILVLAAVTAASAAASVSARPPVVASTMPTASASATPTALPAGHPHIGTAQQTNAPPFFQAPPDTTDEDPALPAGTIRVELRDPLNNVIPNHDVQLGIIQQSVAKGDSRKHLSAKTDAGGFVTWNALDAGAGFAYRVSAHEGDAAFGARPFNLPHDHGMHVVLHVYPPTHDIQRGALIISRSIIHIEMKDDRVQIQQRIDVFNGTPVAWVPEDVILELPADYTALNAMQQMSDVGLDPVAKKGARIHGTFAPGETPIIFSWQLPYDGGTDVDIDIGLPPNIAQLVVRSAAAPGMKLEVQGFRDAVSQVNEEGQRELVTGKQIQDGDAPLRKVHISLRDLPTPGPARLIGTILAVIGVVGGIYLALKKRALVTTSKATIKRDRNRVLDEIAALETAHERKDVGPKTYERAKRELVDELAALLRAAK
jgi:hypothetical protein